MFRWIGLGLLGVSVLGSVADAQGPDVAVGLMLGRPELRRLPPIEQLPLPAEETPVEEMTVELEPEPAPTPWEGSFELGLDGSEGNTKIFNFRFGFDVKRKMGCNVLTIDLDYRKNTSHLNETAHRAYLDWRYERLFAESPWTCFVHGTDDYDEFKAFDVRVTIDIGMGYQLIESECTTLSARVGGGFSREVGGPDDTYVPEAVFGLDFEHRINERQKFTASSEHTPDMTGMNDFRLRNRASWELVVDKRMNLSLKLSVLDNYDSTPNGAEPNDLDYSAVLLWKF